MKVGKSMHKETVFTLVVLSIFFIPAIVFSNGLNFGGLEGADNESLLQTIARLEARVLELEAKLATQDVKEVSVDIGDASTKEIKLAIGALFYNQARLEFGLGEHMRIIDSYAVNPSMEVDEDGRHLKVRITFKTEKLIKSSGIRHTFVGTVLVNEDYSPIKLESLSRPR